MTKLPLMAFAALVVAGGLAAPVLAATPIAAGNVPYCPNGSDNLDNQKDSLATQLHLSTKLNASIDDWNGCLRVISTENGKTTMAFYDPDTLALVAEV